MARRRRRDKETERREADELAELRPYLGLAREIRREVERVTADPGAPAESLVDAVVHIPDQERRTVALRVFEQLSAEQRWAVIAEAFDDDELRATLAAEREALDARGRVDQAVWRRATAARTAGRLDTRLLAPGDVLTLGLFPEREAPAAVARGRASDAAARVITLRVDAAEAADAADEGDGDDEGDEQGRPGALRVVADAFNPGGGHFVTAAYDRETWSAERLESHALVLVGAAPDATEPGAFAPVLFPGARVDVLPAGDALPRTGHLHLGWAALGEVDVFGG